MTQSHSAAALAICLLRSIVSICYVYSNLAALVISALMVTAIGPLSTLRIGSLQGLRADSGDSLSQSRQQAADSDRSHGEHDSGCGYGLLGTLRVATHTERSDYAPFHIPAGSLVFRESTASDNGNVEELGEIRCQTIAPRISWFADDVLVLLTHWRYILPPKLLRGDSAAAWSYIEILSAPVLLPREIKFPHIVRPLSWWSKHQVHPELELEHDLFASINEQPPLSGSKAALILAQHPRKRHKAERSASVDAVHTGMVDGDVSLRSILGRVRAVSTVLPDAGNGHSGFLAEISVDSAQPDDDMPAFIPILFCGQRFLGLFASVCVNDSLFITNLRPAMLFGGRMGRQTVFMTLSTSRAFRIDEFDGLDESQIYVPPASQTPFTQHSQQSLLSQVTHDGTAQSADLSVSGFGTASGSSSEAYVRSPTPRATGDDCHLAVHGGRLESYSGEVTRVVDAVLGIYVVDGTHLLILTFWPLLSPLFVLRPGSRVMADSMHVLLLSNSASYRWELLKLAFPNASDGHPVEARRVLIFGACARSSVRVVEFPALSTPAEFPSIIDGCLAPTVIKQARGVVEIVETLEAFWKLRKKFSVGSTAVESQASESSIEAARQALAMALVLNGHRDVGLDPTRAPFEAFLAFVNHDGLCRATQLVARGPHRVVALREVVRRFLAWRKQRKTQAQPGSDARAAQSLITSVYPLDLQLEGLPLVGKLSVNERGCLYLRDDTAELRVRVGASLGDQYQMDSAKRSTFPGQSMVGHICVWRTWHLAVEDIRFTAGSALNREPESTRHLNLVYAQISDPRALWVDRTFGGVANSTFNPVATGFLFIAHSQAPAMPRSVCTAGGSSWEAVSIVKGVRIALDAGDYLEQLHTKNCGEDGTVVEVGEVDNRDIQAVGIVYRPAQTPAVFAAGSAYIVCGQSTPNYRKPGASLDIALYELGALDHVHPVRLNLADSEPFPAAQLDTGLTEVTQCIPEVRISVVSDNAQRQLWPPPVYSISDLFASHSAGGHVADSCDSSKPRCVLDKIVSVWGIIAQREVKKAVSFVPGKRGDNSRVDPASVIGQLESHITLQDANDSTMTAVVYIKLSSYSHPLGLVPGARIICRDVVFNVSKSSGNPYLTGTPVTSIDAVAAEAIPADPGDTATEMAQEGDQPIGMCIGALYAVQQTCQVELGCYIKSVESLKLSMVCISCKQTVRRMGCGCARKQHYLVPADRGVKRAATAVAEAELLCLVSDGSGIAWMAASGDVALANALALAREELAELYDGAAQSWNGLLTWKAQQHKDQAPPPNWHAAVDRAAATAVNASVLVEGTVVQRGPLPVKRQPLRLDGHDYAMDKLLAPRIAAVRVTRPTAAELSWHMLGRLGM